MHFSKDTIEHLLKLSHLKISEQKKEEYLGQLQGVLDHMQQLDKLPLQQIAEDEMQDETPSREDLAITAENPYTEENAPDWENGCFSVPKSYNPMKNIMNVLIRI